MKSHSEHTAAQPHRRRLVSIRAMLILICVLAISSEIGLRLVGVVDFPIYDVDESIGYIPRSNQSGALLNRNHWVINDRNMNVDRPWNGESAGDLLLTGDSVVWGGNPLDDPDKLGAILQNRLGNFRVWPVSAGSWSVENVCVWFDRNQDVLDDTEYCVWVLNSGDLSPASHWKTDTTHPRERPFSSILYTFQKYAFPRIKRFFISPPSEAPVPSEVVNAQSLKTFVTEVEELSRSGIEFVFVLYPDRQQRAAAADAVGKYEQFRTAVVNGLPPETKIIDLLKYNDWPDEYYRDGIHPSIEGHRRMAEIIEAELATTATR